MNRLRKTVQAFQKRGRVCALLGRILERVGWMVYGNHIPASVSIGANTVFEHHGLGCVVHEKAIIGSNCRIYQNVTIGAKWPAKGGADGVPVIGDNVRIGCGAAILGSVHIGDGAVIGANAVVISDVPPHALAVGVPAIIKE